MEKAISVRQPFADFIKRGVKYIETRTKPTNYRGRVVICSSKKPHQGSYFTVIENRELDINCINFLEQLKFATEIKFGYALCTADLVDCRPMVKADELPARCRLYDGAYSWVFENIRKIDPFPVKGQLGIFNLDVDDLALKPIDGEKIDELIFGKLLN